MPFVVEGTLVKAGAVQIQEDYNEGHLSSGM